MSRSYHVTEKQKRRDYLLNRENDSTPFQGLSKLDELSVKKKLAKWSEKWKRDTTKAGGLRTTKFGFDGTKITVKKVKCRADVPDVKDKK